MDNGARASSRTRGASISQSGGSKTGLGDAAWRSEENNKAIEMRGANDSPVSAPSSGQSLNHMSDMHKFLEHRHT